MPIRAGSKITEAVGKEGVTPPVFTVAPSALSAEGAMPQAHRDGAGPAGKHLLRFLLLPLLKGSTCLGRAQGQKLTSGMGKRVFC